MDAPHISTLVLGFFRRIVRGYFRRHFSAVRLSKASQLCALENERLILYANHGSWWDPMVSVLLGETLMPERNHYAPMDADALARYAILRHIGIFGVEQQSARGAAKFVRTSLDVLARKGVLWITPQGRFADVRERPLEFKPGLAALAARVEGGCTLQPLAIEYAFWDERLPEVLLHFGEPVESSRMSEAALEDALLTAMDELKELTVARNAGAFRALLEGRRGTGGFYQFGQRIVAKLRGREYQAEHTAAAKLRPEERG